MIALLAFGFVVSLPRYLPTARAVTGLVCLGDPNSAAASGTTPCPASAPTFSAPIGSQLRVGVFIQGSDALNGFGVTLKADHTKIAPIGVDLTGTVLPGTPTPIVECLSNILKAGGACPSTDTIDTLDYFVTGGFGLSTSPPTSGILFAAIYNVTGTGSTTIGYQTGCGSASVPTSVPPNTCVTISSGATASLSETAQIANFNNAALPPNLTLSASATSLTPPAASTSTITVTGNNGWPPSGITDSISFTVTAPQHVTASVNPPSCAPSIPCTTTLTVSGTGSGPVQVVGTYQTIVNGETETLSAQATVIVSQPAALSGVTVSPTTVTGASGSATAMVTVTGSNGFTGPVALSLGTTVPTGLTASFNPSTVTLSGTAATTGTSVVTFSGAANTYNTQIKATAGTAIKTSSVVHVTLTPAAGGDFSLSANPLTVSGATNIAAVSTITVAPTGTGFTSDVALTVAATPSTGVTCTLTPTTVTAATGTSVLSCTDTSPGSFTANVMGTGGGKTHTQPVTFNIVQTIAKDFALSAAPTTVPVIAGSSGTSTITVTASGGLTGTITLTNSTTPSTGLTCNLSPKTVTLGTSGTSTLTCNAASSANGMFTTIVTGSNGTVTRTATVVFNVTPPAQPGFSLTANPISVTCNAGEMKTVMITVASQGGFNGIVALVPTINMATGLTATINPTSVTGSGSATLALTCTIAGSYTVTVTGTSGTLSPVMVMIPVTVNSVTAPSFTLTASPSSIQCTSTDTTTHTSTITLTGQNGFKGLATLTVNTLPSGLANPTLSPTSVSSTQTATLTVNCAGATPGTYTASVHGSSPYGQASTPVTITVATGQQQGTFSLSSSPSSITCNIGDTKTSTITVTGANGFSGTVTLSVNTLPSGLANPTLSTTSVASGQTATLTVNCAGATPGTYTTTVHGSSPYVQVSTSVTIIVTAV